MDKDKVEVDGIGRVNDMIIMLRVVTRASRYNYPQHSVFVRRRQFSAWERRVRLPHAIPLQGAQFGGGSGVMR